MSKRTGKSTGMQSSVKFDKGTLNLMGEQVNMKRNLLKLVNYESVIEQLDSKRFFNKVNRSHNFNGGTD